MVITEVNPPLLVVEELPDVLAMVVPSNLKLRVLLAVKAVPVTVTGTSVPASPEVGESVIAASAAAPTVNSSTALT